MAVPVEINNLMLGSVSGYQISRSVRFRSSATAYFNRTFGTPTSQNTWTLSFWTKRGTLGTQVDVFSAGTANRLEFLFATTNTFQIADASTTFITTNAVFRDPSAWYHIVVRANGSGSALQVYVNGVVTTNSTTNNLTTSYWNASGTVGYIGSLGGFSSNYYDGYLTETNFVDGQALTPSSFGEYDSITGVWKPKKYTGTYGTNGFYLNFSDNSASTAATIGKDYSGNGNNWTPNNISVTAGVTYDSMIDSPTSFPDGSTGRGNYAVLNPIGVPYNTGTAAGGNLNWTGAASADKGRAATISMSSGKWYWECTVTATAAGSNSYVGIVKTAGTADSNANRVYYRGDGAVLKYGTSTTGLTTYTTNDVIGIAYDYSAQTLAFYKNNTLVTTATSINLEANLPWVGGYTTTESWAFNAGQRPFTYTPPSGFLALNTQNLPDATIKNGASYMAATTYTGTGASLTIANSANNTIGTTFQPDWVWIKGRSGATDHALYDAVRGTTKDLVSNSTAAETTQATGLTAFGSTGFTIGALAKVNTSAATYVGWQWNAGGSTVTNTSGSISAQVRANPTAGFSIVTYTGTGAAATIGHGLGVAPSMIIIKNRQTTTSWAVYHVSVGANQQLLLNSTNAISADTQGFTATPSSTVFSVGTGASMDTNQTTGGGQHVAYCFSAVAGYSAFGSYTGNASTDGPFVFTGFRPRFLMVKRTNGVGDWMLLDSSRDTSNLVTKGLAANLSSAEAAGDDFDFTANGFKLRDTGTGNNASGGTYIYMAFAENPFKHSLAR
jgi:hypothetical protein